MNRTENEEQSSERAEPPTIRPGQSDASGEKSDVPKAAGDLDGAVVGIVGLGPILSRIAQEEAEADGAEPDGAERMNPVLEESEDS